jgi:ABC-2 type transport system permease protein
MFLAQTWYMTTRLIRRLIRQPWYVALTIIQPIIWLTLYGQLFQRVVDLPGFRATSYIDFLTPGIVIMSALFASGWTGMGVIVDIDRGVMDRLLVSPVSRPAIILSRLLNLSLTTIVQSLILFGLGALLGARYRGGVAGLLVLLVAAVLLGCGFGALSIALGFTLRKQESVIGAVNFVLLPLTFTSPVFMANNLMPHWMRAVAQLNPVNWSVEAGRWALAGQPDWAAVGIRLLLLAVFAFIAVLIALRAFRAHQRAA